MKLGPILVATLMSAGAATTVSAQSTSTTTYQGQPALGWAATDGGYDFGEVTSTEAGLKSWAARLVAERPGLPPLETRSAQQSPADADVPGAMQRLVSKHAPGLAAMTLTPLQLLDVRPDDLVYGTAATMPGWATQEFAVHLRPDDARPLFLTASGYGAVTGAGYEAASQVLKERVLNGGIPGVRVTGLPVLYGGTGITLRAGPEVVTPPWTRCWVFMINDDPLAEWEHDCRSVFVAEDLSAFAVRYGRLPLHAVDAQGQDVRFSVVVAHDVVDAAVPAAAPGGAFFGPENLPLNYTGSAQNGYAVIISGGADRYNNWGRYWNNCSQIYSTLRQKYGLPKSHITVLMSDGTDPATDRDIGTDDAPSYVNTDPDLDQDGADDINGAATHANIVSTLNNLQATLTANDQLFIYITDHGYQESGHDAGANLWNWEHLRDDELESLTHNMACDVLVAMGTCFSGGFVDDFAASVNHRAIAVSCNYDETTAVGATYPNYTQWLYYFSSALRGFFPAAGPTPYQDGAACDADTSGDSRVSLHEAWSYATAHKPAGNSPQYDDNAAGFGDTVFMNHAHLELYNNAPVSYSQIPQEFSFQVQADGWAAVGVASASDHDIQADDNRQLTSPYRSSTFSGTTRDFVVANGHRLGAGTHYAQVFYGAASAYNVEAEWLPVDATLGSVLSYTAAANEVFDLLEANLVAGTSYDLSVQIKSGTPDLGIYVYAPNLDNGSRSTATWLRNAGGAGVDETLTFRPTVNGWHGIVIANETGGSGTYNVLIDESPPLAAPTGLAAGDGTYTTKIHLSWNAASGASYYQVYRNTLNNSATASLLMDWASVLVYDDSTATAGRTYYYWVKSAATSSGDRESAFSVGDTGYVLPATLASDAQVTATGSPAYYRAGDAKWWAAGVRYDVPGENWSLRLYDSAAFGTVLETSAWNTPVDFVAVDGNHAGSTPLGIEAYRVSGTGSATIEFEGYTETLAVGTNTVIWPAGDVVEMWDVPLAAGTTYRFTLHFTSGTNDLGMALFNSLDGDYYRSREQYAARSDSGGAGGDETFTYTTTNIADIYGLCVWANSTNASAFQIRIEPLAAGLWEGDISSNWHTPGNWNDGYVPDAADAVTIPPGCPRYPVISTGNAACQSLTVGEGASLTLSNRQLSVTGDVFHHGQMVLKDSTACQLHVGGGIYWEKTSTCAVSGSSEMYISGNWNFEDGAKVQLTAGYVEFAGTGDSWIRVYDPNCRLYNVRSNKTGGGMVGLSALCEAPIRVNNLYQYSASTLESYTSQPLVIDSFFNNMGGHFSFHYGSLMYTGTPAVGLKPNLGDYLADLVVAGPGKLVLDATYTNTLSVNGLVDIEGGGIIATNMDLLVGGSWSNSVGFTAFVPGMHKVTFNGASAAQTIQGNNTFYDLVDGRSVTDQLLLRGSTAVQHDFTVGFQTAVWAPLTVQHTLDISDPACQLILWGSSQVQATALNLGGRLLVYSGSLLANDLLNNGIYGYLNIYGGNVTLTQGAGVGEWFDLYGTVNLTNGRLDLVGGSGDHYWPLTGTCNFVMNGGVLDFHDGGWRINSGFSGGITNGTLRCGEDMISTTAAFAPAGGLVELYGPLAAKLQLAGGSSVPNLLVNKTNGAVATIATNVTITGNVEIRGGVLKAGTNTLVVSGNWSNSVGTAGFSEDTSRVKFVGALPASIQTDETFYLLELAKTYSDYNGLETSHAINVLSDLVLTDGTMELNTGALLDVNRDVLIANGAGLNANDAAPVEIHVGRHWSNANTDFSSLHGFDPGYDSLVVFDGGAASGNLSTAALTETFNAVRIDRPGGTLRVLNAVTLRSHFDIVNGSFSFAGGPFTHHLRGDLLIDTGGAWYDTTSTVVFDGTMVQNLRHTSMAGWFKNLVVEKSTGLNIAPLLLQSDLLLLGGGTLTVREGYLNLNGHYARCTGNVTVEDGGKLVINAGAWLEVGDPGTFEVQPGGFLDVRGTALAPASIKNWSGPYAFLVDSNAVIRANYAVFSGMNTNGVNIRPGALVEEPYTFHDCVFSNGAMGGTLLCLDNSQNLTVRNAVFPTNVGPGSTNVRKSLRAGGVDFVHATGVFAGEAYDDDPYNLVNWHDGGIVEVHLSGPVVATLHGKYNYSATVNGDLPATPITYSWTITDRSFVNHTHTNLTDALTSCDWTAAGNKVIQVVASNAYTTAQVTLNVDARALGLTLLGRQRIGSTNAVLLLLTGTSGASTYQLQYCTNLVSPLWGVATPIGVSITGLDHTTPLTDLGGPGRDVTTAPKLFYRAVLPGTP